MSFTGMTTDEIITALLNAEDVSALVQTLMPIEAPFLDWLGDSGVSATGIKHEYIEDLMLPHYIIASAAVNSATAATGILVNGLGEALTVGTLIENESAAPELMQVSSIAGPNSILVTRNYDGAGYGSLVAGANLYVRGPAAIEGQDHSGADTARLGSRKANTVGYFNIEIAASGSQFQQKTVGRDTFDDRKAKIQLQAPSMLEKEFLRGKLNAANSLGTTSATRTMKGLRAHLSTINSAIVASSFAANPHLYVGNVWEQAFLQGASNTETWGIVAGRTFFRNLSDLNDTKVQDSQQGEEFKRVVRVYQGAFGRAEIFMARSLPATELLLVSRERCKLVPFRPWEFQLMAKSGDNVKGMLVGEYTGEFHHENAMARLYV